MIDAVVFAEEEQEEVIMVLCEGSEAGGEPKVTEKL